MNRENQFVIQTSELTTYIFILPPSHILPHLRLFSTKVPMPIKINYLLITPSLQTLSTLHRDIKKQMPEKSKLFNVSITPFLQKEQTVSHIERIQQINSSSFEQKYLQMMEQVEAQIEEELLVDFLMEELNWGEKEKIEKVVNAIKGKNGGKLALEGIFFCEHMLSEKQRGKVDQIRRLIEMLSEK